MLLPGAAGLEMPLPGAAGLEMPLPGADSPVAPSLRPLRIPLSPPPRAGGASPNPLPGIPDPAAFPGITLSLSQPHFGKDSGNPGLGKGGCFASLPPLGFSDAPWDHWELELFPETGSGNEGEDLGKGERGNGNE